MRQSPDPTMAELEESVRLAGERVAKLKTMAEMQREDRVALIDELVALRKKHRQTLADLESAEIDLADAEAEAFAKRRR